MTLGRLFFQKRPDILIKQIQIETVALYVWIYCVRSVWTVCMKLDSPYCVINKPIWAVRRQEEKERRLVNDNQVNHWSHLSSLKVTVNESINGFIHCNICSECWLLHMDTRMFFNKPDLISIPIQDDYQHWLKICGHTMTTSICICWTFIFKTNFIHLLIMGAVEIAKSVHNPSPFFAM